MSVGIGLEGCDGNEWVVERFLDMGILEGIGAVGNDGGL